MIQTALFPEIEIKDPEYKKYTGTASPLGFSWVAYFKWHIDELWFNNRKLKHAARFEFIRWRAWKDLLSKSKFKTTPYRRRTWLRLAREKRDRVKRIMREVKRGHKAAWIK